MYRKMCILRQQTSPKRWFGKRTMMSFCDVTNSAHQIQMTTLCRWMNPPHEKFLRTPLNPIYGFGYNEKVQNIWLINLNFGFCTFLAISSQAGVNSLEMTKRLLIHSLEYWTPVFQTTDAINVGDSYGWRKHGSPKLFPFKICLHSFANQSMLISSCFL